MKQASKYYIKSANVWNAHSKGKRKQFKLDEDFLTSLDDIIVDILSCRCPSVVCNDCTDQIIDDTYTAVEGVAFSGDVSDNDICTGDTPVYSYVEGTAVNGTMDVFEDTGEFTFTPTTAGLDTSFDYYWVCGTATGTATVTITTIAAPSGNISVTENVTGETGLTWTATNTPIISVTSVIKNGTALADSADYTVVLATGVFTFGVALVASDALIVTYEY